jgi:hypothetical protein
VNAQILAAVRAFRRLLHVHRVLFERVVNDPEPTEADQLASFRLRMELAENVATRFSVSVGRLDLAVMEHEWHTYERMLEARRARERARAQEPDPIRDAIAREARAIGTRVLADAVAAAAVKELLQLGLLEQFREGGMGGALDASALQVPVGMTSGEFVVALTLCPDCKTELAFPGDVCGLCRPGELPRLHS